MASQLLTMIPDPCFAPAYSRIASRPAVERSHSPRELPAESISPAAPNREIKNEAAFLPQRGRSPPSPMASDSSRLQKTGWAANIPVAASYDDMAARAKSYLDASRNRNSMPTPESESLTQKQQRTNPAPPRPQDTDRSLLDNVSKGSVTPPASFATMPTSPKQPTTYLNSTDSGICMRSHSEDTVAYPSTSRQSREQLTKRIKDELLEDLERNGAARSALDAIFGPNQDAQAAISQITMHPDNASAIRQLTTQLPDNAATMPQALTRMDSNPSTIPIFTAQRVDHPSSAPQRTAPLDSKAFASPLLVAPPAEDHSEMLRPTSRQESNTSAIKSNTQLMHNAYNMPQATAPLDKTSDTSYAIAQRGSHATANTRIPSPRDTHGAGIPHAAAPQGKNVPADCQSATQLEATVAQSTTRPNGYTTATSQRNAQLGSASSIPQTTTQPDRDFSTITQASLQQEKNTATARRTPTQPVRVSTPPQISAQRNNNTYSVGQIAAQPETTSYPRHANAQLDDNASFASGISRTSSPDGDLDGGAQLGRSETAFSIVETHFARPKYTAPSQLPPTTVIDTPVKTLAQNHHPIHTPNGTTLPTLRPGQGIVATPLLADLNPDIHFDSALWPDAARRFMAGAKS